MENQDQNFAQTLQELRDKARVFIREKIKVKFVVVKRIECELREGMLHPNGEMINFFDSPSQAVSAAKDSFNKCYPGKEMKVAKPARAFPRDIGNRQHAAIMIIRAILDADGHEDAVKYVIYKMSPDQIAQLMLRNGEDVYYDLAVFPGDLIE